MTEISEILSMVESRLNLGSEDGKKDNKEFKPPPDITDLATVLNTENSSKGKDFVFRKGTTSDVFDIADDAKHLGGIPRFYNRYFNIKFLNLLIMYKY